MWPHFLPSWKGWKHAAKVWGQIVLRRTKWNSFLSKSECEIKFPSKIWFSWVKFWVKKRIFATKLVTDSSFLMGISIGKWPDFEYHVCSYYNFDKGARVVFFAVSISNSELSLAWCYALAGVFPNIGLKRKSLGCKSGNGSEARNTDIHIRSSFEKQCVL